jgi:type III pantothenate kinase
MLLAIDLGNTNTVLGLFDGEALLAHWRLSTRHGRTADEYTILLHNLFRIDGLSERQVSDVAISSVVPPSLPWLVEGVRATFHLEPLVVDPVRDGGTPILYENPHEVGADRIVNAVGAWEQYGGPLIIIDFGTATTFCAVSREGEYLGGTIAPGVRISAEALFRAAAKLPRVSIEPPPQVIGKTTTQSMQAGLYFGYVALIEGLTARIAREMAGKPRVVATGGLAELFAEALPVIEIVDPFLTLKGLRIIHERRRRSPGRPLGA